MEGYKLLQIQRYNVLSLHLRGLLRPSADFPRRAAERRNKLKLRCRPLFAVPHQRIAHNV